MMSMIDYATKLKELQRFTADYVTTDKMKKN